MIKRIAIIGSGALGAVYGSLLQKTGSFEVRFIADKTRIERYETEGIFVNGERTSFDYTEPNDIMEPAADLIIVAVKYGHLQEAMKAIKHQVGERTTILSLLNGITSEEEIAAEYGEEKLLYAMTNGIDATRKDNEIIYTNPGVISFGEQKNILLSDRVKEVKECFDLANIPYEIPEDMVQTLWYKFMINVGINQASAATGASYRFFQEATFARDLAKAAMLEVVQIAKAKKIPLSVIHIDQFFEKIVIKLSKGGKTSMLQDIEAKRLTEVDMFSKKVISLGKELGIETPVNRTLYQIIRTLEEDF